MTDRSMATEAVWRELRTRLLAFVRKRVGSPEDAEDIVQDVFTRIHESAARLPEIESVNGWVHRIARNAVVDHHRRRAATARVAAALDSEVEEVPPEGDADDSSSELARCLEPLLSELPERYRRALELTELSGDTQRDAAGRLGLSLSGVKSRVQRGRAKLRERLLDCCHVELDRRNGVVDYAPRRPGSCSCR